jgi:hypothetical protein
MKWRQWNVSHIEWNGSKQRRVSLNEGTHTFTIEITTKSGELNLSITGRNGILQGIEASDIHF